MLVAFPHVPLAKPSLRGRMSRYCPSSSVADRVVVTRVDSEKIEWNFKPEHYPEGILCPFHCWLNTRPKGFLPARSRKARPAPWPARTRHCALLAREIGECTDCKLSHGRCARETLRSARDMNPTRASFPVPQLQVAGVPRNKIQMKMKIAPSRSFPHNHTNVAATTHKGSSLSAGAS